MTVYESTYGLMLLITLVPSWMSKPRWKEKDLKGSVHPTNWWSTKKKKKKKPIDSETNHQLLINHVPWFLSKCI